MGRSRSRTSPAARRKTGSSRPSGEPPPGERYDVSAGDSQLEALPRVLKQDELFAVFNPYGDINAMVAGEDGLFFRDTRYLSHYELRFGAKRPLLLSSTVRRDNVVFTVDTTNPDRGAARRLAKDSVHLFRAKFLWHGACHERIKIHNYGSEAAQFALQIAYDADFADIFEVRGQHRRRRGRRLDTKVERTAVVLAYDGLDSRVRTTRLEFDPAPQRISPTSASYTLSLQPDEDATIFVTVTCEPEAVGQEQRGFSVCMRRARQAIREMHGRAAHIYTSNELFNEWTNRSVADLYMLVTRAETGGYPFAGIPWFSTAFGRDGIITALQSLWMDPSIARGVLTYLAATQATDIIPAQEAEPGKILHESRNGEMAALGEVPFGRYYGSVDATPLFVLLAGAYLERTGDRDFIEGIWPNIAAALDWIDAYGDRDNDGFVEYSRQTPTGLLNQGWKDSDDSIFHADGRLAQGPVALCEVQAYVYAAKRRASEMAAVLGHVVQAETLAIEAELLRERFEESFWCEDLSTYALALDGEKRLCRVRSSNAGHVLFAGIAGVERAERVAQGLMRADFFPRWGIRTVAASENRYNPMSYHNGSIWPHDNALIALGFASYGLKDSALRILAGMFDASTFMDLHRLPELFCGFPRRASEGPILYPIACSPQAWSSATAPCLLAACLGMRFDVAARRVRFDRPLLPAFLEEVRIRNLRVGDASVDLLFRRHPHDVSVNITERRGDVDILVTT